MRFQLPVLLVPLLVGTLWAPATLAQGPGGPGPGGPGPLPPLQPPPAPPGNPVTLSKANLGKALFWDEQLSSTGTVACGTCHVSAAGGSDPRSVLGLSRATHPGADGIFGSTDDVTGSPGVPLNAASGAYLSSGFDLLEQVTGRKSPSAVNASYAPELFWDGRADGSFQDPLTGLTVLPAGAALESQVLGPPTSEVEMGHVGRDWGEVVARLAGADPLALSPTVPRALRAWIGGRGYPGLFLEAFGSPEVTPVRVAMAIATYERTLFSNQTPFDADNAGLPGMLTPLERQGRIVFVASGCATCHQGNLLTDDDFHYIGVRPVNDDLGRFAVTGDNADRGAFKTPGLRNVELRAPYFHDGSKATLEEVVDFYDRGGDFDAPVKDPRIVPLGLTVGQKNALLAFLRRPLTDPRLAAELPPFDRPQLYAESDRVPEHYGFPTPGQGGFSPRAVAFEPPALGNGNLTFAVQHGRGGAPAFLLLDFSPAERGIPALGATTFLGLSPLLRVVPAGTLGGVGAGAGFTSHSFGLKADPEFEGLSVYGQWVIVDDGSPGGFISASEGFESVLF